MVVVGDGGDSCDAPEKIDVMANTILYNEKLEKKWIPSKLDFNAWQNDEISGNNNVAEVNTT